MGKVVTIYLSDEEARDLKGFCDENRVTQYNALKTAVKQLLYNPEEAVVEETWIEEEKVYEDHEEEALEVSEDADEIEVAEKSGEEETVSKLIRILRARREKNKENSY